MSCARSWPTLLKAWATVFLLLGVALNSVTFIEREMERTSLRIAAVCLFLALVLSGGSIVGVRLNALKSTWPLILLVIAVLQLEDILLRRWGLRDFLE